MMELEGGKCLRGMNGECDYGACIRIIDAKEFMGQSFRVCNHLRGTLVWKDD